MSGYPRTLGHREIDTSVAAAEGVTAQLGRLQRHVATAIREAVGGLTTYELAKALKMPRWSIHPRVSELRQLGVIRDSGLRRRNVTGRVAIVWVAAEGAKK